MKRYSLFCALAIFLLALLAMPAFSEENPDMSKETSAPAASADPASISTEAATPQAQETVQPKEISIYGEVQSVDPTANTMGVQYYDYDSDEEKTISLTVNNETKLENAALLNDIKQGDWVDATYVAGDGKNMAKNIIVEKEEAIPAEGEKETPPPSTSEDE